MTDWKTLCFELLEAVEDMTVLNDGSDARFDAVAERVRAELAQPASPAEGELTDAELNAMWNCSGIADEYGNHTGNIFEFARAAIAFDRSRRAPVLKEKGSCPACEGSPTAANNPCAVCGCSAAPSTRKEAPVAWLYKGEPDFDGANWQEKWYVTTSEEVARFKSQPEPSIPLFRRPLQNQPSSNP